MTTTKERIALIAVPGVEGGVDECMVYMMPEGSVSERWRSVRLVTRGSRPAAAPLVLLGAALQLVLRRLRGQVDILHLNISHKGSTVRKLFLAAVARLIGVPYVLQIHTGNYATFYAELPGWARTIVRRLFLDSAHAFALGQVFVDLLVEEMGLSPDKVSVLRNGVPLKEPAHIVADTASPDESATGDDTPVKLLFTGRIGERKGTFDLLQALGRIQDLPWSAVISGDGDVDRARAMARDLGIADRIEVKGWQPRHEIDRFVAEAEVFLLPSNREAMSISLLEAMAGELCCIATPVGAQGDILVHGENSLVCRPGDVDGLEAAIRKAVAEPELRHRLGVAARSTVIEECTIEANRERLLGTYDQALT